MKRRGSLLAGAAVAAGAAGLGAGLWRLRHPADDPAEGLWTRSFDAPAGGQLSLAGFRGRPLLLNFWATWCPPCVREMPLLDRFHRDNSALGWQVAGLAVDQIGPVNKFLGEHPVAYPIGLAGAAGIDLSRRLGNQGGGLPFSVVFDRTGRKIDQKLGQISEQELQAWAGKLSRA